MNIDNITISQAREIAAMFGNQSAAEVSPYEIGQNYFFRTVTYFYTGRIKFLSSNEIVLEDAAWIADTGRLSSALETENFSEVEMYPEGREVILNRGAVVDAVRINTLPTETK